MEKKFRLKLANGRTSYLRLSHVIELFERIHKIKVVEAAQLIGYDKNGAEVYEGDKFIGNYRGKDYEYEAALWGVAKEKYGVAPIKFDYSEMELVTDG